MPMDPNETLRRIRAALDTIASLGNKPAAVNELVDAVVDLDGWLSRGGFLPDDWRPEELRSAERAYDLVNPEGD